MRSLQPTRGTTALRALSSSFTSLSLSSTRQTQTRLFSATPSSQTKTISLQRIPSDPIPAYPLGERRIYKQSNKGLYGNSRIRFGNNISEDHKVKTPRAWRPNIHRKKLWSESLGVWVRTKLSLRVLRTIRKEGGVDNYVLKSKSARIKELGPGGWKLRWLVMQTSKVQTQFAKDREALGVEAPDSFTGEGHPALDNTDLVKVMLDRATPGPISAASRKIVAERAEQLAALQMGKEMAQMAAMQEFALGEEAEVPEEMIAEEVEETRDPVVVKGREEKTA